VASTVTERNRRAPLLAEAVRRESADRREAMLAGIELAEPGLRLEIEAILAEPAAPGRGASGLTLTSAPGEALAPTLAGGLPALEGRRLGAYRVIRELGRGGIGVVYLAVRDDAEFRKDVAIKVLQRGHESEDVVRRFRKERQILAALDHPYIAKLHDGGSTEEGAPYLVMEYVEGQAIDRYCDAGGLGVAARLDLFRKACEAVHFAHQNLVVHRDLKPANILVTADGNPKLLDFGIAKLLKPDVFATGFDPTQMDTRPMTPDYASPEQVRGEAITTASDVYSLGVILYELLAGRRPYRVRGRSFPEMVRIVCEETPARASLAVRQAEPRAPAGPGPPAPAEAVARARGTTPERLARQLRGDLDNIVGVAMRKEPARRYPSVEQLSEDVRRHLRGLPVAARADTVLYRSSKFVRRHRAGVALFVLLVVSLVAFASAMAVQSARLERQRNRAEQEAAKAGAINDYMQKTLGAANPSEGQGKDVTVLSALRSAALTVDSAFPAQPELAAAVRNTIGATYMRLGRYDEAEPLLRASLESRRSRQGNAHPDVSESLTNLGGLRLYQGDYRGAEGYFREALDLRRRHLGRHAAVAASANDLGLALTYLGRYDEAEPLHRESLALRRELLGPENRAVAESLNNLAFLLHDRGDHAAAEAMYREVVALDRRLLGDAHPDLAIDLDNFASLLDDKGDAAGAEPLFREALAIRRQALGSAHPDVAKSLNNLASLLERRGDLGASEALFREAVALRRGLFGEEGHPDLATNLNNLARVLTSAGRLREALGLYREAQAMYRRTLGEGHWLLAASLAGSGRCLARLGRHGEAEGELLAALPRLQTGLGERHERARAVVDELVRLYEAWKRPEKAAEYRALAGLLARRD
jgi:serine/threonine-protein kinase